MSKGSARRPGDKKQFDENFDKIFGKRSPNLDKDQWIARAIKAGAPENYAKGLYNIYGIDKGSELTPEEVVAIDQERLCKPIVDLEDITKHDALLVQPASSEYPIARYRIPREEWIRRMILSGVQSEDYADSLFLAYTDNEGYSELTPEQVLKDDKQYHPQLQQEPTEETIMKQDALLAAPYDNDGIIIEDSVPQQYRLARKPGGGDLILQGLYGWRGTDRGGSEWREIPIVYLTQIGVDIGTQASDETVLQRITPNGEITFDPVKREYTVWDETYAYTVCTTNYPKVAEAALKAYGDYYLNEDQEPLLNDIVNNPNNGC